MTSVARLLGDRFPRVSMTAHAFDFLNKPDRLRALLSGADLALVALDATGGP